MTGRHPYTSWDEQRRTLRALAGVPHDDIALVVKCSPPTLRKWFRHELDVATIEVNARVAQTLFQQATPPGNIAATVFWLKARSGWRERRIAPADDPATPGQQVVVIRRMFSPIGCENVATELSPPLLEGDSHDARP
jgi:hypothetical protein